MGLIKYVNYTYSLYSSGKFGTTKLWYVTTKHATVIGNGLDISCGEAINFSKAGVCYEINQTPFYLTLCSLDRITLNMESSFKDDPAISTKLVEFWSMNISVEATDK